MKIGILTFHQAINYGAVLQAYALQEFLRSQNHDVYIVNYQPEYLVNSYKLLYLPSFKNEGLLMFLKLLVRELLVLPIRLKRHFVFKRFIHKKLHIANIDLKNKDSDFDAFVIGSDQIWNVLLTNGIDRVFWGDFSAAQNKLLVAYGASAGNMSVLDSGNREYMLSRLSKFAFIGVREKQLETYIKNKGFAVTHVLDPVLLAGKEVFLRLQKQSNPSPKPYLLFFTLNRDEKAIPIAYDIAAKLRLPVIEIVSSKESVFISNIKQTLSPEEFINYIYNAHYIVTTSFHGTAFSILFEKDFSSIICSSNDRVSSLLSQYKLEHRAVEITASEYDISSIDYNPVKIIYSKEKSKSLEFLGSLKKTPVLKEL